VAIDGFSQKFQDHASGVFNGTCSKDKFGKKYEINLHALFSFSFF